MKAISITNNLEYDVQECNGWYYIIVHGHINGLERVLYSIDEIRTGYEYSHYTINNELYEGFYTNTLEYFKTHEVKKTHQMTLF